MAKRITTSVKAMADELGTVRQQILKLEARETELKEQIRKSGFKRFDGLKFRLELSISERCTPSWKIIAEKAGASQQLISANTKTQKIVTIKTTRIPR